MIASIHRTGLALGGALLASALALPVHAHEAGDWLIKAGLTQVKPKSNNGSVVNGAVNLDVDSNVRPSLSVTYMATRNIGVELLAAVPFKHTVTASGALAGDIITTKQLPPTLTVQWHFLPESTVQPYVGVGLNYTTFFSTRTTGALANNSVKLDSSWGLAAMAGVDIKLSDRWFANASLRYIDIESKVKLNGTDIGKAKISPWVATIGVGYRF